VISRTDSTCTHQGRCLFCGQEIDAATSLTDQAPPVAGDCSICLYCAGLATFTGCSNHVRLCTDEELRVFRRDPMVVAAREVVRVRVRTEYLAKPPTGRQVVRKLTSGRNHYLDGADGLWLKLTNFGSEFWGMVDEVVTLCFVHLPGRNASSGAVVAMQPGSPVTCPQCLRMAAAGLAMYPNQRKELNG